MLRELVTYYRPKDLHETLHLLSQPHTAALAGGTQLLGRTDTTIQAVVDLQDLALDYIRVESDGLHIGALTRLQALVTDATVRAIASGLIARCAMQAAQFTERNAATIGGSVASAPAWHDLLPALLVVDSWVVVQNAEGSSHIPLDVLLANRRTHLARGSLISEVIVPQQPAGARFAYQRVSRTPRDRAMVAVAVRVARTHEGMPSDIRVAVGGASETAIRLKTVEPLLRGITLQDIRNAMDAMQHGVSPPGDHLASSEYRREMMGVLLRRAVEAVWPVHGWE